MSALIKGSLELIKKYVKCFAAKETYHFNEGIYQKFLIKF